MSNFILKSYNQKTEIEKPHFFILNKGNNSGKPLLTPCPNCFVIQFTCNHDKEQAYWLLYCLWQSKTFYPYLRGSVIPFIILPDMKQCIKNGLEKSQRNPEHFQKMVTVFQNMNQLEKQFRQNLFTFENVILLYVIFFNNLLDFTCNFQYQDSIFLPAYLQVYFVLLIKYLLQICQLKILFYFCIVFCFITNLLILNALNMQTIKFPVVSIICCLFLFAFHSTVCSSSNTNLVSFKNQGYQIFNKDNFVIKCNSKLKINSEALRLAKEKGMNFILSSYIASENENSESTGVIYNIQISDISSQYKNATISKLNEITIKYLDSYCSSLKVNNISYSRPMFNGLNSIEYSFLQNGVLPTKAIIFIKDKKAYMLQVGTRKDLSKKYTNFKESFRFIK